MLCGWEETGILTNIVINGQSAVELHSCPGRGFWVEEQSTQQALIYCCREELYLLYCRFYHILYIKCGEKAVFMAL